MFFRGVAERAHFGLRMSQNEAAPPGLTGLLNTKCCVCRLFKPLGGFLHDAQVDVLLDIELVLHEAKFACRIDVAL